MEFRGRRSIRSVLPGYQGEVLVALDGIDLVVGRGESLGVVGESGSGKTTLARCIAGLHVPTAGSISLDGEILQPRRTRLMRRRIQIVFQDPYSSLDPRQTVRAAILEVLSVHRMVARRELPSRLAELLALVHLGPELQHAYPRQLSGGQRQRVSIARALALQPELLVADEPVSALDVSVQASILSLLLDLRARLGLSLVFIAHDLSVVRNVCDRVAVMYLGRIVETATTQDLFSNPRHPYTQGLLRAAPSLVPGHWETRVGVTGDPPSPYEIPGGCRFRGRCPIAQEVCEALDPPLVAGAAGGHAAACHFAWQPPNRGQGPAPGIGDAPASI